MMPLNRPLAPLAAACFTACLAAMLVAGPAQADRKDRNTIIGAGVGAAAGAVLSNGDPMATIGGAAVGGLIGNVTTNDGRRYDGHHHHHRRHHHDQSRHHRGHHDRHR